ncbi:MAG TPA: PKD domain-containing protein [Chitinophagaceae bacterium]|nr:PKD domain-containing protein [Chitinophagaceae bacterium]
MKKKLLSICVILSSLIPAYAAHISGGEMYYTFLSQSGNLYTYSITLKLFRDVASTGPALEPTQNIAIYEKGTNFLAWSGTVSQTQMYSLTLGTPNPCIIAPPTVSFTIALYTFQVTIPASINGYVISFQRCCRLAGITNVTAPSANYGSTYTAEIPGFDPISSGPTNNSARFVGQDTVIICSGYPFQYSFNAVDSDGDSLSYTFCAAYTTSPGSNSPNPPLPPPYDQLGYNFPYSGSGPMGAGVTINPVTGVMSGTAPSAGLYVVTVCVGEWRSGQLIATQRKDLHIRVSDCDLATVTLEPNGYINCNDYTVSFNNLSPSPLINNYFWDFGDLSTLSDTSRSASVSYTYPDTGVYVVKVIANKDQPCSDSTTAQVRVFPGFFPDFDHVGVCVNTPIQFTDRTTATYGTINFWRYDFGVNSLSNDTARQQNPQYTYNAIGSYTAELIVGSSKGCRDTVYSTIDIIDKPAITMAFKDTLICNDTIQLSANGSVGAISWTPNYNITNSTSVTPSVWPATTTTYTVEFNENGCRNTDTVRVRVVNTVSLSASNDTSICANDPVQLSANTNGLQYSWLPDPTLNNPNILFPIATPLTTTTYQLISRIGNCVATEDVTVTIVPRPIVNAGSDVVICYNSSTQLNAQTNGTSFTWSNANSLNDPGVLNPVATPTNTTSYIISATDPSTGCPKPSYDTVTVTILPKVNAFAGNDTSIIASLPLQLKATGGVSYQWTPLTGLDNPNIQGPVAMLDGNPEYVTYVVTVADQAGCTDTASITIRIYKTGPEIFVPTGFTPNGDGRNDVFRPVYLGMQTVDYFRIYNRWGSLIYSHDKNDGQGWDGTINGIKQNTGAFIWMVRATDILGKVHFKRGTVTLIR